MIPGKLALQKWRHSTRVLLRRWFGEAPTGAVLYRGPSQFNGQPIAVVATGLHRASGNTKTGDMVQVWILPDGDEPPHVAVKTGSDVAVCGDCRHRGTTCYVLVHNAPRQVYATLQAGGYPALDADQVARVFAGALVRFGAWGDPAAVPAAVWRPIVDVARGFTGYTHRWRALAPSVWGFLMASVDSDVEHADAVARGWRVFRVHTEDHPPMAAKVCPAASEALTAGRVSCATCRLCDGLQRGAKRPSIAIAAHGRARLNF